MKVPHLSITKHCASREVPILNGTVYSVESWAADNKRKTTYVKSYEEALHRSSKAGTHIIIRNSSNVHWNEKELTLTVHYPLKLYVVTKDNEGLQSSDEMDLLRKENIDKLRLLRPHLEKVFGEASVQFFDSQVLRVAEVDASLRNFFSEKKPVRKKKKETGPQYSCCVAVRDLETFPVLIHKVQA